MRESPSLDDELRAVTAALAHRGPDGHDVARGQRHFLAHFHFWTTPEEVGELQPLVDPASGACFAFEGRLDSREQLLASSHIHRDSNPPSDAALAFGHLLSRGASALSDLVGPFALVLFDSRASTLLAARDGAGQRSLFYRRDEAGLSLASEESALLGSGPSRADNETVARFFALRPPREGATFFEGINEIPPGHTLVVTPDSTELRRFWNPKPLDLGSRARDNDWVEAFRDTFGQVIVAQTRSRSRVGVLMSGGLDSCSIAAFAAAGSAGPLATFSWVFNDFPVSDEREFIGPMIERFKLDATLIPADGEWPLRDPASRVVSPNAPHEDLYRTLRKRAFELARARGVQALLSGEGGDELFLPADHWLRSLVKRARFGDIRREIRILLGRPGEKDWGWRVRGFRSAVFRTFGLGRGRRRYPHPEWIGPDAKRILDRHADYTISSGDFQLRRSRTLLEPNPVARPSIALRDAVDQGCDWRLPYRDTRLLELALAIPPHLLGTPTSPKLLLRLATAGLLPEVVRTRSRVSVLSPLAARGLYERELHRVRETIFAKKAAWLPFVDEAWLSARWANPRLETWEDRGMLIGWRCYCFERWLERACVQISLG